MMHASDECEAWNDPGRRYLGPVRTGVGCARCGRQCHCRSRRRHWLHDGHRFPGQRIAVARPARRTARTSSPSPRPKRRSCCAGISTRRTRTSIAAGSRCSAAAPPTRRASTSAPISFAARAAVRDGDPLCEATPLPPEQLVPGWRESAARYYTSMEAVGAALMRSLARGLGLDETSFDAAFRDGISTLRLTRYPFARGRRRGSVRRAQRGETSADRRGACRFRACHAACPGRGRGAAGAAA